MLQLGCSRSRWAASGAQLESQGKLAARVVICGQEKGRGRGEGA